jgi:hypothetical protein
MQDEFAGFTLKIIEGGLKNEKSGKASIGVPGNTNPGMAP